MKTKKNLRLVVKLMSIMFLVGFLMGCNQDEDEIVEKAQTQQKSYTDCLRKYADIQKSIAQIGMTRKEQTRGLYEDTVFAEYELQALQEELNAILLEISNRFDLTADLEEYQKKALNLSEEEQDIMSLDPYAYLDYAEKYKSNEYSQILKNVMEGSSDIPKVEEILCNENLKMNEQLTLITVSVVQDVVIEKPIPDGPVDYKRSACDDEHNARTMLCLATYIAATGVVVGSVALSGGTFTLFAGAKFVIATMAFIKCTRDSQRIYELCKNQR